MNASETFEMLAGTPLQNGTLHDYTDVSVKMSKLPLGTWSNPEFPIPENHRRIVQLILDEPDRTKAYHDLAEAYMTSDAAFRMTVSKYWDFGKKWKFDRTLPLLRRVRDDLIWYSINVKYSVDLRDDLMGIATDYHLCDANGIDPDEVFRSVAEVSMPFIGQLLIGFINRDPESRSLKAFRLKKVALPDGSFEIESDW